ncbi:MAG TPA: hypothetical protein PKW32_09835 [Verrucomicrobiota bacterium]|nr:hypothetical protein [Verrucomicrobiota bacterium]
MRDQTTVELKPSNARPVEELANAYAEQIQQTTRRRLALRRFYDGMSIRWRRAATTGPNSDKFLVWVWSFDTFAEVVVWPVERLDALAAEITEEEVETEFGRLAVQHQTNDCD